MTSKRDPLNYLEDILESVDLILTYTKNKSESDLETSQAIENAILLRFEIIGEAVRQVPVVFKKKHTGIPWRDMVDMRNKILHEYFGLNWHIIWKTITEDLPPLKKQIKRILEIPRIDTFVVL